jgi:hypothetical protein
LLFFLVVGEVKEIPTLNQKTLSLCNSVLLEVVCTCPKRYSLHRYNVPVFQLGIRQYKERHL